MMTTMLLQANVVSARSSLSPLPLEELQQLAAVFGMIKSDYVEPVDEKKLINDAIAGMVSGLDPHSQFFDKKNFKEFREGTTGKFIGVGIEIGMEDGLVKIVSPIEGSPAFRAGLKSGDLITKIDDTAVRGLALDQAVKKMRGEPNTKVQLTIYRKSETRSFPLTILREEIRMQSVRSKIVEPGYAWLRVSQFQDRTVDDFARKLEEIYKQEPNLKGLVLDLRNDPGGLLEASVAISAAFLQKDQEVVSTNGQISESKASFKASPDFYMHRSGNDPLRKLPAAELKIDRAFVMDLETSEKSRTIARSIVELARSLNLRVVAEGVETVGQRDILIAMGCDDLQGFLFCMPVNAQEIQRMATGGFAGPGGSGGFRDSLYATDFQGELAGRPTDIAALRG